MELKYIWESEKMHLWQRSNRTFMELKFIKVSQYVRRKKF